jgi:hypothetical protein
LEGEKFTRTRSDARACSSPIAAQIGDRRIIVAIKQCRLGLHSDKRGAKDFADEAGPKFVRAHRRARDFRCAIILLRIWRGGLSIQTSAAELDDKQTASPDPVRAAALAGFGVSGIGSAHLLGLEESLGGVNRN